MTIDDLQDIADGKNVFIDVASSNPIITFRPRKYVDDEWVAIAYDKQEQPVAFIYAPNDIAVVCQEIPY